MPRVTGPISTTGAGDTYPTHIAELGQGGLMTVADAAARDAIPAARREQGMIVFTQDDLLFWVLNAGPWAFDDTDWDSFVTASVPDATGSVKGKLKLDGGDLGGTADAVRIKRTVMFIVAAHGDTNPADYTCASAAGNEVEINQAIAAANALPTGAKVWLRGAFVVSGDGLMPKSNVTLSSDGFASIEHDSSSSSFSDIGSKPIIRNGTEDIDGFEVEDVLLIGDSTTNSTSCSIYLTGDGDPDAPVGAPTISNFAMRRVYFRENSSLPIRIFGTTGKLSMSNCEFTHNADPGFGWNEEIIAMGNHSLNSRDNGFSFSRGNRKVVCIGNTSENATFWGIWLSGFGNEDGPSYVVCNGNVVINSGKSCIALINAASNVACSGNVVDQNHNRSTNSDIDGIQLRGASVTDRASNYVVDGNLIMNPARAGISYGWIDGLNITNNYIYNAGTQFKADGTTAISSTDTTTNVGVLQFHDTTNTWIDGNQVIDNRATPYTNYDFYPVPPSATSQITYGTNKSSGMRNSRNTLTITKVVAPGNPVTISADGPDANIDIQINAQGTGEVQIRGGGGINVHTTNSGTASQSKVNFSGGAVTLKTGSITAYRLDPATTTQLSFSVLSGGAITPSSGLSPLLYLQGDATSGKGVAGFNTGMIFKRRAIADAAFTALATDYLHGYSTLTTSHTITLPNAAGVAGRTLIFKDEAGTAASHNLTLSPWTLGSVSFTNTDVDATNNIIGLSTFIQTGTPFSFTTAGTPPGGLSASTTYYVTRNTVVLKNTFANPGTEANDSSVGKIAWQNPSNASGSDNTYATWTSDGNIDPSDPRGDTFTFSGSITTGTKILTSSTSVFNILTDAGKYVRVPGAGAAGADLITTISSVQTPTQATLAINAGTTVSGVTSACGSTDTLQSNYLKVTNFGFSVPAAASIEGIKVQVEARSTSTTLAVSKGYDYVAELIKGGTIQGNNKATLTTAFSGSDSTVSYGGTDDTWGLSLSPSDVNASNFGFVWQVQSILGTVNVDNVIVTVYYTLPNDIKVADTQSHALAGTAIDITDAGSGTFNMASPAQTIDNASTKVININSGVIAVYSDGLSWQVQGGLYNTSQFASISPLTTLGDIIYENSTPTPVRLAGNTTATKKYLSQTGNGTISAAPAWAQIAAADLSDGTTGTGTIALADSPAFTTSPTAPTQAPGDNSTKIATTAYVNTAVLQSPSKDGVKYASIAALPSIVYANGSSGVGATLTGVALAAISLDSSSPSIGDRVLIKNQASTFQNGIYTVTATGSGAAVFVLTRTADFDQTTDIYTGASTYVVSGSTLAGTTWDVNSADNPTMGSGAITFAQTNGPGSVTAGNGITVTGSSIAIDTSIAVDKTTAQALTNKDLSGPGNIFPSSSGNNFGMQFGAVSFAPNNSTTYYVGGSVGQTPNTTAANARMVIPKTGTITDVYITLFNTTTTPTSETSTISIRLNNTTDTTITASANLNTATTAPTTYSITGQSISVTAGDYIEIKWVTPAWVTKPTAVRIWGIVFIQ